jgi:hypothetical protein
VGSPIAVTLSRPSLAGISTREGLVCGPPVSARLSRWEGSLRLRGQASMPCVWTEAYSMGVLQSGFALPGVTQQWYRLRQCRRNRKVLQGLEAGQALGCESWRPSQSLISDMYGSLQAGRSSRAGHMPVAESVSWQLHPAAAWPLMRGLAARSP